MISKPFLYLQLKHDVNYQKHLTSYFEGALEELAIQLKRIGSSRLDLYLGKIRAETIFDELKRQLVNLNCFEQIHYENWILRNNGFQTLQISDLSVWTLKIGSKEGAYIHIHPGRYSKHTKRIRAGLLKTAIMGAVVYRKGIVGELNTTVINELRIKYLDLSPIKSIKKDGQLLQLISLFNE